MNSMPVDVPTPLDTKLYAGTVKPHILCSVLASCQICKTAGCACAGNTGKVSPPPRFSNPDMHLGTCATHVPWCMTGSLTSGGGQTFPAFRAYALLLNSSIISVSGSELVQVCIRYCMLDTGIDKIPNLRNSSIHIRSYLHPLAFN